MPKTRSKYIPPELLIAVEFGYKQCEKGNNLQMALAQFQKIRMGAGHGHKLRRTK